MSLHPQEIPAVPADTARVAHAAFPRGTVAMQLRDAVGICYHDASFAPLFAPQGQPAEAPWRLAVVTVLQFAEGLTDRQAADAVRGHIDWKYALGLDLTDPGFDHSVLSEFRTRLVEGSMEEHLLDALLVHCRERGWLKARGRQRTDSTHVLGAMRALTRLLCVGETLRHTLNVLAEVAPAWLRGQIAPEWADRYSLRFDEMRLPKEQAARHRLAETIGRDGATLRAAVWATAAPPWLREVPAVEMLRRVWVQQYYVTPAGGVQWRTEKDIPPAALQINSPYDPDPRYSVKRTTTWIGYKVHLTETCDEDLPHLMTQVATTLATTQDTDMTAPIQDALAAKALLPETHVVDTGYTDADVLVSSQTEHGIDLLGPVRADTSWQARTPDAFALSSFTIAWEAEQVTCPTGCTSVKWQPAQDSGSRAVLRVEFAAADCRACASRARCTHSATQPRQLTLRPQAQHLAVQAARQRQTTATFAIAYAVRAGIEGTLSQGTRAFGLRRARYVGLAKTHLQHVLTAVAMNVRRLVAWLTATPRTGTRQSRFAALAAAA